MSVPPVEAQASTAPAWCAGQSTRFMVGIVSRPVVTTFEITLPESELQRPLAITDILAGPPRVGGSVSARPRPAPSRRPSCLASPTIVPVL
jgi:hypothetical protein